MKLSESFGRWNGKDKAEAARVTKTKEQRGAAKAKITSAKSLFVVSLLVVLLAAVPLSFAENDCYPQFKTPLTVHVVDSRGYAIPNVAVWIYYQKSSTYRKYVNGRYEAVYTLSGPRYTDKGGMADFFLYNNEPNADKLDCNVRVIVNFFGENYTATLSLENKPTPFEVKIEDATTIPVQVYEEGKPVSSFSIIFDTANGGSQSYSFNGSLAYLTVPFGKLSGYLYLPYRGIKRIFYEDITKNYSGLRIDFTREPLQISISDDIGKGIPFTADMDGKLYSSNGEPLTVMLYSKDYPLTVHAANSTIHATVNPAMRVFTYVVDTHAPFVSNVLVNYSAEETEKSGTLSFVLSFIARDVGREASGISSIDVRYRLGNSKASDYPLSSSVKFDGEKYVARLYDAKKDNIYFMINVSDVWGNYRLVYGKILLKAETEESGQNTSPPSTGTNTNISSNASNASQGQGSAQAAQTGTGTSSSTKQKPKGKGIDWIFILKIIGGIIGLIVIIGILYTIKIMYIDEE